MSLESSTVASTLDAIRERAGMISEKHPSFTLVLDHTGVLAGDATVTTSPRDEHSTVTVAEERVEIDVSHADTGTIVSYVTSLCAPNVPTVLWWSGMSESSRPTFYALLPLATTLLVDSSGGSRDESGLRALTAFHEEHPEVALRDLAWMRLGPWQDMIATFFDDPALLEELYAIRSLKISSGSDSEALYLAGWLASRLGWTAVAHGSFTDTAGKPVAFDRKRVGDIRRVQSVCLDTETSWYHGEVTEDDGVVSVWVEGEHAREPRLYPLQAIDNASLLERAVLEPGIDDLFETSLSSAGTLLS